MLRMLTVAVAALTLAACATGPNPIDAATRQAVFVQDAGLVWSVEDDQRLANADYVTGKDDLVKRLEAAVEAAFATSPAGADPVRFEIDVKQYSRVGALAGNLLGGSNMVTADVRVIRVADGAVLGVYEDVYGMMASNGGIIGAVVQGISKPDVVGVMSGSFAAELRRRYDRD